MKYLELVCVSKEEMACFFHQMSDSRNGVIKRLSRNLVGIRI